VGNCGSAAVRAVLGEKGWGSLASKMRVGRLPDQSGRSTRHTNINTFWKGSPMSDSKIKPCPVCGQRLAPDAQNCTACGKFDPHGVYIGRFKVAVMFFGVLLFLTYLDKTGVISFLELWNHFVK